MRSPLYCHLMRHVVIILLRATGNAPILKQNKFRVSSIKRFLYIHEFVRRQLLLQERDPLVIKCARARARACACA